MRFTSCVYPNTTPVVEVVVCDDGGASDDDSLCSWAGECDDVGKNDWWKGLMSLDRHPDWPAKFAQAD